MLLFVKFYNFLCGNILASCSSNNTMLMRGFQLHPSATVASDVFQSFDSQTGEELLLLNSSSTRKSSLTVNKLIPVDYFGLFSLQKQKDLQQKFQHEQQVILSSHQQQITSLWSDGTNAYTSFLAHPSFRYSSLWKSSRAAILDSQNPFAVAQQPPVSSLVPSVISNDSNYQTDKQSLQTLNTTAINQQQWPQFNYVDHSSILFARQEFLLTQALNVTSPPTISATMLGSYHLGQGCSFESFPFDSSSHLDNLSSFAHNESPAMTTNSINCFMKQSNGIESTVPFLDEVTDENESTRLRTRTEDSSSLINICIQNPVASH